MKNKQDKPTNATEPPKKVYFYTYAPKETNYPFILRNIKQKPLKCSHEIVDIGIYDLIKSENHQHDKTKLKEWGLLKTDGWKVVPDCLDLQGEFKIATGFDNVEYTKELHYELYNPLDPHHLPVIQSNYGDLNSLQDYIRWFKKEFGTPLYLAVGSVCKMDKKERTVRLLREVKREFPNTWIHAFGLRLNHLNDSKYYINSFDSTSWTFPRGVGEPSCKNKEMCLEYFYNYLERFEELVGFNPNQKSLGCIYE